MSTKKIGKKLIGAMPKTHGPESKTDGKNGSRVVPKDKHGRVFDADLHISDPKTGKPVLIKDGHLRIKTGKGLPTGRPSKMADLEPEPKQEPTEDAPGPGPEPAKPVVNMTGVAVSETIFMLSQTLGGEDWKPTATEKDYMATSWAAYLDAKGVDDLPPGVLLFMAMLTYALPRLRKQNTQAAIKKGWARLKEKIEKRG
ncbi:hypothetical protein ES703_43355 [subsurface metagenome]